jgi:GNAT superfamily N-acetyltransferase
MRFAEAAQAPEIAALIESAYRSEESRRGWTTEAHLIEGKRTSVAEIESLIATPLARFVVAVEHEAIVGCVLTRNNDGIGYIGMFAVRPGLQGAGLGAGILAFAEQKVAGLWSCAKIEMTVISIREDLIVYYERRGYARTGTKPFPFESEPGAKRTDFHFVVLTKTLA